MLEFDIDIGEEPVTAEVRGQLQARTWRKGEWVLPLISLDRIHQETKAAAPEALKPQERHASGPGDHSTSATSGAASLWTSCAIKGGVQDRGPSACNTLKAWNDTGVGNRSGEDFGATRRILGMQGRAYPPASENTGLPPVVQSSYNKPITNQQAGNRQGITIVQSPQEQFLPRTQPIHCLQEAAGGGAAGLPWSNTATTSSTPADRIVVSRRSDSAARTRSAKRAHAPLKRAFAEEESNEEATGGSCQQHMTDDVVDDEIEDAVAMLPRKLKRLRRCEVSSNAAKDPGREADFPEAKQELSRASKASQAAALIDNREYSRAPSAIKTKSRNTFDPVSPQKAMTGCPGEMQAGLEKRQCRPPNNRVQASMSAFLQRKSPPPAANTSAGAYGVPIDLTEGDDFDFEPEAAVQGGLAAADSDNDVDWGEESAALPKAVPPASNPAAGLVSTHQAARSSSRAGPPWWHRLPDFVPLAALKDGVNPRNGAQVHINYERQFKDEKPSPKGPTGRSSKRRTAPKRTAGGNRKGNGKSSAARKGFWAGRGRRRFSNR